MMVALALVLAPIAWAATKGEKPAGGDRSPGAPAAHAISTLTGIAISPLLGTGAYGAYQWVRAGEGGRAALPWYAKPQFWLPALLIVGLCAAKDSLGTALPPMLKKPLDILEVAENKASGLVAAGAVVPFAMDSFTKMFLHSAQAAPGAVGPTGLAMIPGVAMSWAPVLDVLTIPFGVAVFLIVWMASHAINVLILLSPWGAIDAGLKAARTGLLGLLTLTATMNPVLGAVLSVIVVIIAYLVAGWAFRLTVFGTIMCWEFFTRRRARFAPAASGNALFAGAAYPKIPIRTYGRLVRRTDGGLEFVYRPWLVLPPRTAPLPEGPAGLAVGEGLFLSTVVRAEGGTLFLLPPRYRGHEAKLAQVCGFGGGVKPAGLRKAWSSLKELVGGRTAVVAEANAGSAS